METGEQFIRKLLQSGRCSFTMEEAARELGKTGLALNLVLQRLKKAHWIILVSRGFYLALDVQQQATGKLDPIWFVEDWASYLKMNYYVGGLSAAALHGASHQQPMQFQVFSDRQVRSIKRQGVQISSFYKKSILLEWREQRKSPSGYFHISNPELTAYDMLAFPRCCPSLDHAATVLVELAEVIDAKRLADLPRAGCMLSSLQRLGWLLEYVKWPEKAERLHKELARISLNWAKLESRLPAGGNRNDRWRVLENADVQPDIER